MENKDKDDVKTSDLFDKKLLIKAMVGTAILDAGVGALVSEDPIFCGAIGVASSIAAYATLKTFFKTEEKNEKRLKEEKAIEF